MAGFKVDFFKGIRPRISATKLREGEAEIAQNVKLGSGDLEPIPDKSTLQACVRSEVRTIYLYHDDAGDIWFEWTDRVTVARGPIKNDEFNRVYYTGDTLGNGGPKFTTSELAHGLDVGPFPEDWLYIGVPAPTAAPTVSIVQLPEDKEPFERLAGQLETDEFEIDQVLYTVFPGSGTDDDQWNLSSEALGSIAFDVQIGTAFRVTEVINVNKVRIESATDPGIAMRTVNSDKSTVNDWHPMDETGSTKEADFIGWRIPAGMTVKIAGHNLGVGDVIVVSSINFVPQYFAALTTDFFNQDWDTPVTFFDSGVTYTEVRDARVSASAVSGTSRFQLSGSFYYDVDRASSDASELEDRTYVYTYVNEFGEEGPPSPPSEVTPQLDGRSVLLSDMALPPTIGYNISKMRLYRSNSTEAGTEYQFVKEFDLSRTTRDEVLSADLGEIIPSTTWDPPPTGMDGITAMPNGMMVGFKGRNLHFCEPYYPHAYPPEYDRAIDYEIIGIASFGNSVAVMTEGWPYIITGVHPRNVNVRPIKVNLSCVSAASIATDGNKVYFASSEGLVEIDDTGARVVTKQFADKEDWALYSPTTMVGSFYEGRYYGFYDFSGGEPDPVITAEVGGTITDAEEAEIVAGGLVILLTLYNDTWVPSGTSFNNQRQAIIDGLTASTNQTLGWNNIIRDTELAVADVVRTNDFVVTITLPAASGYAITQAETIQPVIPAAALTLSNSSLNTGSTFKIEPDAPSATVTLSGTLNGAAESDIVSGGKTVIITLTNDTWEDTLPTIYKQLLINWMNSSTDEDGGWNDTVPQLIDPDTDVVRTSDTVVTITLPAVADYSVTENETISVVVPHQLLVLQQDQNAFSSNSLGIVATGAESALFSGTAVTDGVTENEIVAGGETLIITLTNDTWIAAGTGPIGTTAQSQSLIDAIVAASSPANGWNNQVLAAIDVSTDLVRTSSTVATITLPAVSGYSISTNETISCTIPNALLTTRTTDLFVSNTFGVTAQTPVTCIVTGTITASANEKDIRTGGKTIILTLSDDTWKAAGTGPIGSTSDTQAIINGLDSAQSEATGWDAVVKAGLNPATDVVRTSDTVCTITLPAFASYNTTADETITATVPAAALNISAAPVVASPTFDVDFLAPATATISGTMTQDPDSADIITGGRTIIITLANDTWVAAGAAFNAIRQDIIDNMLAAASPSFGWNNTVITNGLVPSDVVRTSSTVVTITLPAIAAYDIGNTTEVVTVTVPHEALVLTDGSDVVASPTIAIDATTTATGRIILGYADLHNSGNNNAQTAVSFNDPDYWVENGNFEASTDDLFDVAASTEGSLVLVVEAGASTEVYSSPDKGASWNLRKTVTGIKDDAQVAWVHSTWDNFFFLTAAEFGNIQFLYSVDSTTWIDISAAVQANATVSASTAAIPRAVLYGGGDVVYIHTKLNGSGGYALIPSGDLSTVAITADWGSAIPGAITEFSEPAMDSPCSGNGYILDIAHPDSTVQWNLQSMPHGGSAFTDQGKMPSSDNQLGPRRIAFGNNIWLALDLYTKGWKVDTSGQSAGYELDPDNWTRISSYLIGAGSFTLRELWYDTDYGFVAAGTTGSGASATTKVYTSPNGSTWTERVELEAPATMVLYAGDSINRINGSALD